MVGNESANCDIMKCQRYAFEIWNFKHGLCSISSYYENITLKSNVCSCSIVHSCTLIYVACLMIHLATAADFGKTMMSTK